MNTEEVKATEPSEDQMKAWKEKHGTIYTLELENGTGKMVIRKPKIQDLERATASDPQKKKPFNFNRSIITNCKLYETPGLMDNDDNIQEIYAMLDEVIEIRQGTVKKN